MLKQVASRYHQMGWPTNGPGNEGNVLQASYQTEYATHVHTNTHIPAVHPRTNTAAIGKLLAASAIGAPLLTVPKIISTPVLSFRAIVRFG